jgi:Domain of unknown function (DUF4214)
VLDPGELSATTDSSGNYGFTDLTPGTYTVRQVFERDHGVVRTSPSGFSYHETVVGGENLTGRDFGNVLISQVSPVEVNAIIFPPSPDVDTAWVRGLYRSLLARDAEPGGLAQWTAFLRSGGDGPDMRTLVVSAIWNSPEHRGVQVDHYYATFLHRTADAVGRNEWVQYFLDGASEGDVVQGFVLSPEYRNAHSDVTAWVAELYKDILSRPADEAGLQSWVGAIQSHSLTMAQVARAIENSDESVLRAIDSYYSAFLHRAGDPGGRQAWFDLLHSQPDMVGSVAQRFLAGTHEIQEYFAYAQQAVS